MNCINFPSTAVISPTLSPVAWPHHIPGYTGYVPQEKFRPGHSFAYDLNPVDKIDPNYGKSRSVKNPIFHGPFGSDGILLDPLCSSKCGKYINPSRYPSFSSTKGYIPREASVLAQNPIACNHLVSVANEDTWRDKLFVNDPLEFNKSEYCFKRKKLRKIPRQDPPAFSRRSGVFPAGGGGCIPGVMLPDSRLMPKNGNNMVEEGICCEELEPEKPKELETWCDTFGRKPPPREQSCGSSFYIPRPKRFQQ